MDYFITYNKSHVHIGIPKPNWKCSRPSTTNALGNRHSRDDLLQVQPIKISLLPGQAGSTRNFSGVAATLSPALFVLCAIRSPSICQHMGYGAEQCLSLWHPQVLLCSLAPDCCRWCCAVLSSLGLVFRSLGQLMEQVDRAHGEKFHTTQTPAAPLWFTEVTWSCPLLSQQGCISTQWVEAGIKSVQRGKPLLRGAGPAGLVGERCWQDWGSWQWWYVRLQQWDESKGSLEREKDFMMVVTPWLALFISSSRERYSLGTACDLCFSVLGFDRANTIMKMSLKQNRSMAAPCSICCTSTKHLQGRYAEALEYTSRHIKLLFD